VGVREGNELEVVSYEPQAISKRDRGYVCGLIVEGRRRSNAEGVEAQSSLRRGKMKKPLGHRGRAALSGTGCFYVGAE
jgi:hypothetical protein